MAEVSQNQELGRLMDSGFGINLKMLIAPLIIDSGFTLEEAVDCVKIPLVNILLDPKPVIESISSFLREGVRAQLDQ